MIDLYTEEDINKELKQIAEKLNGKVFNNYQEFEDACDFDNYDACNWILKRTTIGIMNVLAQMRNIIRELSTLEIRM
jgi:hypothetical protein